MFAGAGRHRRGFYIHLNDECLTHINASYHYNNDKTSFKHRKTQRKFLPTV